MSSFSISFDDSTASLDFALSVIEEFRVSSKQALNIIQEVAKAVSQWRTVAKKCNVSNAEIDRMASAFEHDDLQKALNI